jgi:antitoxin FitA
MSQLIVRNLEEEVVQALRERAARHGRSAEAEHRELLRAALLSPPADDPKAVLLDMPEVGDDEDFARPRDLPRRLDL